MSTLRSFLNMDCVGTITSAASGLPKLEASTFVLVDTSLKGDGRESTYQYIGIDGDPAYPMMVRVGHYPNASSTNISVKVSSFVKELDTVTSVETIKPCTITIATNMPCKSGVPNANEMSQLLIAMMGWLVLWDTGAINTAQLEALQFGITSQLIDQEPSGTL